MIFLYPLKKRGGQLTYSLQVSDQFVCLYCYLILIDRLIGVSIGRFSACLLACLCP